ncbi:MAG TPA: hypothetical protein VGH73_12065 [Thermoanaerobaculia bacterium]|jgi:hypothetical protein
MADEQPAGPVEHLIPVDCDLVSSTLNLTLPAVGIKPGDRVVWQFFGAPGDWSPWIEFRPDAHFLGPFISLTQSGSAVWGTCSEQQLLGSGPFMYRALLQKGQGTAWENGAASIHSGAGRLTLNAPDTGTTKRFTVTQNGDALSVSPLGVIVTASDTVEWSFENIKRDAEAWRPQVTFHRYDGSGEVANLYLGPFTGLTTGADRLRGMGNNHVAGTYYFQVAIVRISDGSILWISSPDPAIDNRGGVGDPTAPGGTGG